MISFIVIGKNEGWKLTKCFTSIFETVNQNKIDEYEVLYIDSESSDDSLERAKKFPKIKVIMLSGEVNAAIGRNVGVKKSKGDILFFIDGDMELIPHFFTYVFEKDSKSLHYPFVNGYLIHKFYDGKFNYLYTQEEVVPTQKIFRNVTGGLMIIERGLWLKVGGMDERLIRNQDLDIGLRLSKKGFPALLYNQLFAVHHTINYDDKSRVIYFYFSKALLSPGLLMRKHLFNPNYLKRHYLDVMFVFFLLISIIILFFNQIVGLTLFVIYILIQIVRSILRPKKVNFTLHKLILNILFYLYSIVGFLFYYPNQPKYKIKEINN